MSDTLLAERKKYTPPVEVLRPQGLNRFLAKVHKNEEAKTGSGIYIPTQAQDYPTTGEVVALSPVFEKTEDGREIYPDVKVGMCVKVTMNGWSRFDLDGETYAIGSAQNVIAAYDPADFCQE